MTPQEVLDRLAPVLAEQGLEVELLGTEGDVVRLKGRRTAPGPPTAFLVRALEGTFRRYTPEFRRVRLEEYEAPPSPPAAPEPAPPGPALLGIPGIDLAGEDRRRAARALEAFMALSLRRGARVVKVRGLEEAHALHAAEKWADLYRDTFLSRHAEAGHPGSWVVHFDRPCGDEHCTAGQEEEIMPASVLAFDPPAGPGPLEP